MKGFEKMENDIYGHEAVELGGLDHFTEAEDLFVDGSLACLARRS